MFTGLRAKCGRPRHNLPLFQIPNPEFRFPNSVWGMGNLEYRTMSLVIEGDVTGWDMGCRTLEFYVNNLAKEGTRKEGMAN